MVSKFGINRFSLFSRILTALGSDDTREVAPSVLQGLCKAEKHGLKGGRDG